MHSFTSNPDNEWRPAGDYSRELALSEIRYQTIPMDVPRARRHILCAFIQNKDRRSVQLQAPAFVQVCPDYLFPGETAVILMNASAYETASLSLAASALSELKVRFLTNAKIQIIPKDRFCLADIRWTKGAPDIAAIIRTPKDAASIKAYSVSLLLCRDGSQLVCGTQTAVFRPESDNPGVSFSIHADSFISVPDTWHIHLHGSPIGTAYKLRQSGSDNPSDFREFRLCVRAEVPL